MWLLIISFAAVIATALWYSRAENDIYLFKLLSLILWGTTIMVLVDHVGGFLIEGGEFFDLTLEGAAVGFVMLITALVIWEIALVLKDPRGVIWRRTEKK